MASSITSVDANGTAVSVMSSMHTGGLMQVTGLDFNTSPKQNDHGGGAEQHFLPQIDGRFKKKQEMFSNHWGIFRFYLNVRTSFSCLNLIIKFKDILGHFRKC